MLKFVLIVWLGVVRTPDATVLEFDTYQECAAARMGVIVTHQEVTAICAQVLSEIIRGPAGAEAR